MTGEFKVSAVTENIAISLVDYAAAPSVLAALRQEPVASAEFMTTGMILLVDGGNHYAYIGRFTILMVRVRKPLSWACFDALPCVANFLSVYENRQGLHAVEVL